MGAMTSPFSSTDSRTIQSYLRLAFATLLAWLTWGAFHDTYGNVPIVSDVSTAIHEFGHVLFMPFGIPILGTTMVILGGSLTEVAFPLLFVVYFLRKRDDGRRRDVFAAMVCLWWSAIGLLATAIYCADSRAGKLMLLDGLTGQESEGHDWYNLLDRWELLRAPHADRALDAHDRNPHVRREHRHRFLERCRTTARASGR
jgi:hypothetical protein